MADSGSCVRPHPSVGFDLCILFNPAELLRTVYDRHTKWILIGMFMPDPTFCLILIEKQKVYILESRLFLYYDTVFAIETDFDILESRNNADTLLKATVEITHNTNY
jgi:hypothetical protein